MEIAEKKLGFRTLLDVIPLDSSLVKGSHGRVNLPEELRPVILLPDKNPLYEQNVKAQEVHSIILDHLFPDGHQG